jgi:prefoldin subunit 5
MVDAYLAQRRAIYANGNSSFLDQEINRYSRNLKTLEAEIQATRSRYDVLDMAQDIVLATNRLDGIVQRQNQVRERRVAVQTEIIAVKANLSRQPPTVLDFREATNNTGNDEARNTLVRLEQERTHIASQYGPDWPALREVEAKIRTVRGQISSTGGALYFSERTIRNPAVDVLNNRLASLEVEDKALEQQLGELADQSSVADQRIKSLREADGQLHSLQLTRDVAENIFRQLSVRQPGAVFQDNVVEERNANMRVVQPASAPLIGKTLAISYLAGGGFLGLLLGIACGVVGTLLQQIYLMPSEAERDLNLPNLGEIGLDIMSGGIPKNTQGISSLAALLQDVTVGGRLLNTLQIIAVDESDGKTAVLRALAIELAQGYERRTLILDLQGDGNGQARAFGRAGAHGTPVAPCPVAVITTDIPDLFVSVEAPRSIFGDKRGSVARARAALEALAPDFAFVLVVANPDMSDHLVRRLTGLVDANLLVLRAEHTRAAVATRLCDTVLAAGGNMLGFVFVGRKFYVPRWLYRRL